MGSGFRLTHSHKAGMADEGLCLGFRVYGSGSCRRFVGNSDPEALKGEGFQPRTVIPHSCMNQRINSINSKRSATESLRSARKAQRERERE